MESHDYSLYILSKDNDSVSKQIFLMSEDLHHTGKISFYSIFSCFYSNVIVEASFISVFECNWESRL